jgi:hypothetical protein
MPQRGGALQRGDLSTLVHGCCGGLGRELAAGLWRPRRDDRGQRGSTGSSCGLAGVRGVSNFSGCLGLPGHSLVVEPCCPGIFVGDHCFPASHDGSRRIGRGRLGDGTPSCVSICAHGLPAARASVTDRCRRSTCGWIGVYHPPDLTAVDGHCGNIDRRRARRGGNARRPDGRVRALRPRHLGDVPGRAGDLPAVHRLRVCAQLYDA